MKRNENNHRAIDMAVLWETGSFSENGSIWKSTAEGVLKRCLKA
jgi:hypothetical protein